MYQFCKRGCDMWNGRIPNNIKYAVFSDRRMREIF